MVDFRVTLCRPTPPTVDDETPPAEIKADMAQLIESMKDLSAQELMDQVRPGGQSLNSE